MSSTSEHQGSLAVALQHAERLLAKAPALAEAQAREILKVHPSSVPAIRLLAIAQKRQDRNDAACATLKAAVEANPRSVELTFDLGASLADLGQSKDSIAAFRKCVVLAPDLPEAWLALADQLTLAGAAEEADAAYARHIKASTKNPVLMHAAAALCDNKLAVAERALRPYLKEHPTDVAAIRMLAETGSRLGRYDDAEMLLARCLELAPGFVAARHNYASVLHRQGRFAEALAQTELLLKQDSAHPNYRALEAALLGRIGDFERAIACYESLLKQYPEQPKGWLSFGHALRAVGRQDEAIAAYRKSIALQPWFGEAWWSLANLKTVRFTEEDTRAMKRQVERGDLSPEDLLHLHFALGKALEDQKAFAESFENYAKGNAIRHRTSGYDPDDVSGQVRRAKALFTKEFFHARPGFGSDAKDPIFIVGLPRAGSTLIEQILSSHSQIEGTMELPDIIALAQRLGGRRKKKEISAYPEVLADLSGEQLKALGQEYLERTRIQRRLARPYFVDKMPNNFSHVGFIHLILPNARIIDARRHPLSCCLSGFKQHFARGQGFTYDLAELGRYYRDYVELMAHFDDVLPGRVHRVIHERLIENPETEIRKLLDYCGLPFEQGCVNFHETERAVRTASSEQVRRPIFKDALDQWRSFEPWLGPLKNALGDVLLHYPEAPPFHT